VIEEGERVLVVDDWAETGSKALTARRLIEQCGGVYAGLSLLVDQLSAGVRAQLVPVATVAFARIHVKDLLNATNFEISVRLTTIWK